MKILIAILLICLFPATGFSGQKDAAGANQYVLPESVKEAALNLAPLHQTDHFLQLYSLDSLVMLGQTAKQWAEQYISPEEEAHADMILSIAHIQDKEYRRALDLLQQALLIYERIRHAKGQAAALHFMAFIHEKWGNFVQGEKFYRQSIILYEVNQDQAELVYTLNKLGDIYTKLKRYHKALVYYQKGLETAEEIKRPDLIQLSHLNLGKTQLKREDQAIALHHLQQAFQLDGLTGDQELATTIQHHLGAAHLQQGYRDSALLHLESAFKLAEVRNHLETLNRTAAQLYLLYEEEEDHEKALYYHKILKSSADSITKEDYSEQAKLAKNDHAYHVELLHYEHLLKQEKLNQKMSLAGLVITLLFTGIIGRHYYKEKAALKLLGKTHEEVLLTRNQLIVKEKLAFLGQMAAGIAHEIKNPLNFVNNFAEGSLELTQELIDELEKQNQFQQNEPSSKIREIIQDLNQNAIIINKNGHRANRIVNSIMQHASGEEGRYQMVDLHTLLNENINLACHTFRVIDPTFVVNIQKDYYPAIKLVNLIPQDLERVLLNIFDNAFQALNRKRKERENGFNPILKITTSLQSEHLKISVCDNGVGIPEENIGKIFRPFYTTQSVENKNIGLGLSISYDIIVMKHRGKLEVDSKIGTFTEFRIILPKVS